MEKNNSNLFKYDFAISYAGEDKTIAEDICNRIKENPLNLSVFFAPNEKHQLIGKNGENFFEELFSKSKEVIVVISKYYKKKKWTRYEWDVILKRSVENRFIPIKLDDTEIIGLPSNIIFEPYNENSIEIADLCINKLLEFEKGNSIEENSDNLKQIDDTIKHPHKVNIKNSYSVLIKEYIQESNEMKIEELINITTKNSILAIENSQYNTQEDPSKISYLQRIKKYKENILNLLEVISTGCYWNKQFNYSLFFKQIQRIDSKTIKPTYGKKTPFHNLRYYPSLLLFYASGISLTVKEKYAQLRDLFNLIIEVEDKQPTPLFIMDPVKIMHGVLEEDTKYLNHNSQILYEELKDIFINNIFYFEEDYSKAFDRFEYLYSLFYAESTVRKNRRFWAPIGKYKKSGWRYDLHKPAISIEIDKEISNNQNNWLPIKLGLFESNIADIKKKFDDWLDK